MQVNQHHQRTGPTFSVLDNFCFLPALGTRDMFSRLWCGLQVFPPLAAVRCSLGTGYMHLAVLLIPSKVFLLNCLSALLKRNIYRPLVFNRDLKIRGRRWQENVAEKVNSRSFNLHRDYSKSLDLSNEGEPSYT